LIFNPKDADRLLKILFGRAIMRRAGLVIGLVISVCGLWTRGVKAEVLAEYTYSDDDSLFSPDKQGWTLAPGTEEDVNFFNQHGTSLLFNLSPGVPLPLISKTIPTSSFNNPWSFTGTVRMPGNSQEEFGYFMFADDGVNLWHMSLYNHGVDSIDGVYMGGDPNGPVLGVTATKVFPEPVPDKPFDGFHDWSIADDDGAGGQAPRLRLDGVDVDNPDDAPTIVEAIPAPSMFPAGTVGWGSLNPNEAGFMQMQHFVFEGGAVAGKPGDFNGSGAVDGADFVLWQKNLGAADEGVLNGNGDGANGVDGGDLTLWRSNFAMSQGAVAVAVPEPQSLALLVAGIGVLFSRSRRQSV
jgi:hypothetical protein